MSRRIEGLTFARYSSSPWPKQKRGRGARAAGLRYEAKVGSELVRRRLDFARGPWVEFRDRNGKGFAQPDFVVFSNDESWIVLESKLSQTQAAFGQLFGLYLPLLSFLHPEKELVPVQVCKILREGGDVIEDLKDARRGATWHWLPH